MRRFRGKAKWRPRQEVGKKNKTEERFENEILHTLKATGAVDSWTYDCIILRVGTDKCWYSPDFMVFRENGDIEFVDVKGGAGFEDDALVKIKAAAAQYPQFLWSSWMYRKKEWTERNFGL